MRTRSRPRWRRRSPHGAGGQIKAQNEIIDARSGGAAMAQWRLDQRHVASPVAGTVADVIALPENRSRPGAGGFDPGTRNTFVRFFVPDRRCTKSILVRRSRSSARLSAEPVGENLLRRPLRPNTRRRIYSESTRGKLVFLVEARPERSQATSLGGTAGVGSPKGFGSAAMNDYVIDVSELRKSFARERSSTADAAGRQG